MTNIFKSASKMVFILMTLALIAGLFMGIVDSKDFMMLAGMAFAYYFTKKSDVVDTIAK